MDKKRSKEGGKSGASWMALYVPMCVRTILRWKMRRSGAEQRCVEWQQMAMMDGCGRSFLGKGNSITAGKPAPMPDKLNGKKGGGARKRMDERRKMQI